jgi:predicted nucleic acid-binding protein
MPERTQWVIDTSAYTHLCRAGHADILQTLAPGGIILVPDDVDTEIKQGQELYPEIPSVGDASWAELAVLTETEAFTQLTVKAAMGGGPTQHLGECAVIACAQHRNLIALLDERAAIAQARARDVKWHDTLWIVVEAYATTLSYDRARAARIVDDLIRTGMYLPIKSGESLFTWAYQEGLLPHRPE